MLIWLSLVLLVVPMQVDSQTPPPMTTRPWKPVTDGWDRNNNLPNPQTQHDRCRQHDRSWLCDPNSMLTNAQSEKVNSKLDEIHRANENQPVCQCGGECVPAAVAVVNRLRDFSAEDLKHSMEFHAAKTLQLWNYVNPNCQTGFLVFMSWQQNEIYVAVRPNLKLNVTENCRAQINDTTLHCQDDKVHCIMKLLDAYRSVMLGQPCHESGGSSTLPVELIVIIVLAIILFIAVIVAIVVAVRYFQAKKPVSASSQRAEQEQEQTQLKPTSA